MQAIGETVPWGVDRVDADVVHNDARGQSMEGMQPIFTSIRFDTPNRAIKPGYTGVSHQIRTNPEPVAISHSMALFITLRYIELIWKSQTGYSNRIKGTRSRP